MPSKKQYNLVNDDAYDCRIPLYNEEAFHHGITFHAKYIGSLDVPRPTSRVEIVAAMRRIRYEFKSKSVKKKKVSITISVDGVKVVIRNKKKSNQWLWDENKFVIMHHPIYRIFYVSHDSQDLKIFSYIARDGGTNAFKCNVFKSKKKSQAMRIVRTVGQAFEVCHKLSLAIASSQGCGSLTEDVDYSQLPDQSHKGDGASEPNSCDIPVEEASSSKCHEIEAVPSAQENASAKKLPNNKNTVGPDAGVCSLTHQIQLLKNQLEAQTQHMETVTSQVQLLKDQLAAETAARLQSQAQNEHLLRCNRELLDHITKLVHHFHGLEGKSFTGNTSDTRQTPQLAPLPNTVSSVINSTSLPSSLADATKVGKNSDRHVMESLFPGSTRDGLSNENSMFDRSLSSSSFPFPLLSNSPQLENRHFYLTGQSLPGSPSRRNFIADSESLAKSPSPSSGSFPMSSSRPLEEYAGTTNLKESPTSDIPSSASSGYLKKKHRVADSWDSSALFKNNSAGKPSPTTNDSHKPHSTENSQFWSSSPPTPNDSFIASITRDLAKISASQDDPLISEARFPTLFSRS